ncbi:MAG: serine/threonine-protein phosphatase [Gammaproteobacteria bacterium]|nr:serine/threonine-protein phosphatase [Gammaproteobacteria bacterium]
MRYVAGQANRLGNRANNQDRCLVLERDDAVLLVVADGMGGHARGDLAAQAFVDTVSRQFRARQGLEDPAQFLREAFREAHRTIQRVGQAQKPPIEPLTTGVACLIQDGTAHWAHVGDSRAYLIRQGQVALRTRDHTRVAEMVASGLLTEQQARLHPLRNHVSLCLGGKLQAPPVTLGPAIYLLPGDILLLCSDGLWSAVSEKRLTNMLDNADLPRALDALAEAAERASYPQSDNVSGVVLRWESARDTQPAATQTDSGTEAIDTTHTHDPVDRAIADIHQALADYEREMQGK